MRRTQVFSSSENGAHEETRPERRRPANSAAARARGSYPGRARGQVRSRRLGCQPGHACEDRGTRALRERRRIVRAGTGSEDRLTRLVSAGCFVRFGCPRPLNPGSIREPKRCRTRAAPFVLPLGTPQFGPLHRPCLTPTVSISTGDRSPHAQNLPRRMTPRRRASAFRLPLQPSPPPETALRLRYDFPDFTTAHHAAPRRQRTSMSEPLKNFHSRTIA
jgi:hypothetical protein